MTSWLKQSNTKRVFRDVPINEDSFKKNIIKDGINIGKHCYEPYLFDKDSGISISNDIPDEL